jgi:hypothetical protein
MSETAVSEAMAPSVDPGEVPPVDIRGLVDNVTANRLYGWVYDASKPGERLQVELRVAGETVVSTIADLPRPDLAKNGVGDGCHAFEFALTPELRKRRSELSVVACNALGQVFPVAVRMRVPEQDTGNRLLELVVEQRRLSTSIETLDERIRQLPDTEQYQQTVSRQIELLERLAALELWLARLDRHLAERSETAPPKRSAVDVTQLILFLLLGGALLVAIGTGFILRAG